jgi:Kef-type K+ transport system membrane component KefB/Trk K+ transport system NAD-binding subunit
MEAVFVELSLIMAIAAIVAAIAKLFKQPLIIAYIVAGILASPHFLGLMESAELVAGLAQVGMALLLFIVGLQLNPKVLKKLGGPSLLAGLGQVIITAGLGYYLAILLGFDPTAAWFIAAALTFSSTIIIMKLISDKGELNSLYGRLSVGLLLVQDLIVVLVLLFVASSGSGLSVSELVIGTILKLLFLSVPLVLFSVYFLPKITRFAAESRELLFIFSFGWAFLIATLFYYFEFSIEIGALVAGITLSVSPYREEISSRIRPVRDFFVILFFIWLGSSMVFESISDLILPIIILTLFVLVVEPIIIMALLGWLGFRKRTSFLTGLAMAQISEFSLILAALGVKNELIDDQVFGVIAVVGLITIAISSYLIIYGKKLYLYFSKYLNIFERKDITKSDYISEQKRPEVILFGLNRIGHSLIDALKEISQSYLVVDNDPEVIDEMKKDGLEYIFGDATDPELLDDLNFSNTKMVVSTIPDYEVNVDLITRLKKTNQRAVIIVVAHQIDEAKNLYEQGADFVLMPHFLGGDYGAKIIRQFGFNLERYYLKKRNHLEELNRRKKKKHEHPKPEGER